MKKIILLIPFALMGHVVLAQQGTTQPTGTASQENLNQLGADNVNGVVRTFDGRYAGMKGTPYFLDSWGKATLNLQNDLTYDRIELKYNVYENNFLYRKTDGTEMILNAQYVKDFVLKDSLGLRNYEFIRVADAKTDDLKLHQLFFLKLHDGDKVQLVMLPQKKLIKPDYKDAYSPGRNYEELAAEQVYYIIGKDKSLQKVSLNRRSLLKVIADKESEVKDYLSREKIDASTESGWIKALAFYESL